MKILVVEDEILARQSLIKSLQSLGYEDILEAFGGIDAIEVIHINKPDIIIADIRMPGMDGIELLKRLKEKCEDLIFIFLSGYNLFEYAQKAVSLGAFHYLLKPIKTEELDNVLKKAESLLEEKIQQTEKVSQMKTKIDQGLEYMRRHFILELVNQSKGSQEYIENKLDELNIRFDYRSFCILIISIDNYQKYSENLSLKDIEQIYFNIESIISKVLSANGIPCYAFQSENDISFLLNYNSNDVSENVYIYDICSNTKKTIDSFIQNPTTIGIGLNVSSISNLTMAYQTAKQAVAQRFVKGGNKIFTYEPSPAFQENYGIITQKTEQDLITNMEKCDLGAVIIMLKELYHPFAIINDSNKSKLIKLNLQLIFLIYKVLGQAALNPEKIYGDELMLYNQVNIYENIDLIIEWFDEKFKICFEFISSSRTNSSKKIIDTAKEYIQNNLNKDITLDVISKHVHLNPVYFSKLFKQETGENFIDYVTGNRIIMAKRLLKENNYKASEVCRMVGFNDVKHFYKVFKKHTGFTPGAYKGI